MSDLLNKMAGIPFTFSRGGGPYADRQPHQSERNYFAANPRVAGMATEDGKVILNDFSGLSPQNREAVRTNELARLLMQNDPAYKPAFALTPQQSQNLNSTTYANAPEQMRQDTITARLFSGDPSGGTATPEQGQFVNALQTYFGVYGAPFSTKGGR